MYWLLLLLAVGLVRRTVCQGASGGVPVPPVGSDYHDRGQDGSYRYGFQTGDQGGHYHAAVASKENQVAGRFGSRDPSTGRIAETQYTAGQRGFRARGPNIARRMDISQAKIPYNPPVDPKSPNYNPTYEGYHDPNEDPSYEFNFRTPTYQRKESSDSRGRVDGAYSFVDDVGERHDVRYEAGSRIGFNVKTPFPDSKPFTGLFYSGPTKPGGLARGRTSIQQAGDGSYRFVAAGPDQRRTEVSDALGNVRGSYTYLDDKGQQRTVEYIAGPNIGYKVINKGIGPKFPPVPPFVPPQNLFPNFPSKFEELNPNNFQKPPPGASTTGGGPPGQGGDSFEGLFGEGGGGPPSPTKRPTTGQPFPSTPFGSTPPFGTTSPPLTGGGGGPADFLGDLDPFSTGQGGGSSKPPGFPSKPGGSPTSTTSGPSGPTGQGGFPGFPGSRPQPTGTGFGSDSGELPEDCCGDTNGLFTTGAPTATGSTATTGGGGGGGGGGFGEDLFPPLAAFPEDDPSAASPQKPRPTPQPLPSQDDDFLGSSPFGDLPPKFNKNFNKSPPQDNRNEPKDDNDFLGSSKTFLGFPPGVSVRGHVQSLDILPYGSRIPPPGLALERHITHDTR